MNIRISVTLIALMCSCKPLTEPSDQYSSPSFSIVGSMDSRQFGIQAGIDNYYLSTNYYLDSDNVACFYGEFTQECKDCKTKFRITFHNYRSLVTGGLFFRDSAIYIGSYDFLRTGQPNLLFYDFNFKSKPEGIGFVRSNSWIINNNEVSNKSEINARLRPKTRQTIDYSTIFSSNCAARIILNLRVPPKTRPLILPVFVQTSVDKNNSLFHFVASGNSNSSYYWDFGNGSKAVGESVFYGYQNANNYLVKLTQVNGTDTNEYTKWVNVRNFPVCITNIDYSYSLSFDLNNYSTVQIDYTDENGKTYASSNIDQNDNSYFEIIETNDYLYNKNKQRTRMIAFKTDCTLSDGNKSISLKNLVGRIAVAMPD